MNDEREPVTVEAFATQLKSRIEQLGRVRGNYVISSDLYSAIDDALKQSDPATEGYPVMLYLGGDLNQYRTVTSSGEEKIALSQGWTREARPAFQPGFPKCYTERRWGYPRRVTLLNPDEEREFLLATDSSRWELDPNNLMGGTGVPLRTIIAERKTQLKRALDELPLAPKE